MGLPLLLAALTLLSISLASDSSSMYSRTSHVAFKDQSHLLTRQIQFCKPVPPPGTCEESCGPGHIECVSFPNCFNPSAGQTCCSDGSYCSKGYYCTDAGCCPTGSSLSDCGAISSLATLAGTPETATAAASSAAASLSNLLPSTTGLSVPAFSSFDSLFQTTTSSPTSTTPSTLSATTNANGGGAVTQGTASPTQGTARASQALAGAAPERMGANVVAWVVAGFAAML
ncbi:putative secreted protein [Elaphomyces granulatus]